jgi:D-alanine-D-alanine ligase
MKIAIIYNRESKEVINLFGIPNREKYGKDTIRMISDALKKSGHQVETFEGDKRIIDKLEQFMPRVVKGERPGLAFNLSYGIQGKARYTHVPSILEMVGIPYVGSSPLAHSLALDKVVTKIILMQNGLPTPEFAVLKDPEDELPKMGFPLIVKPKSEAVSFGIRIVNTEEELREAARDIFDNFGQPVLIEQFIEGREINVGLLGNSPLEALPPVEIVFGEEGPPILTYEDKTHRSHRKVLYKCPAEIDQETTARAQELAKRGFVALGCYDCARVDMRIDRNGKLYILEINSLPSLGPGGSYVLAAKHMGLDYTALVSRLVDVASARYFGTPTPPMIGVAKKENRADIAFAYLVERRDRLERRLNEWCNISSRTSDPIGKRLAAQTLASTMEDLRLRLVESMTDDKSHWLWETNKGFEGGTLLVLHVDIPQSQNVPVQTFRRDPEYLYGEGIGSSRAPLVMVEHALRALRAQRLLAGMPLGVLCYSDEGVDAAYSGRTIREITKRASRVLIVQPGTADGKAVTQRRGQVKYCLIVEGKPLRLGHTSKNPEALLWTAAKLLKLAKLTDRNKKIAVSATDVEVEMFPMLMPHRVTTKLLVSYYDSEGLGRTKDAMTNILASKGLKIKLQEISNRPPLKERPLIKSLARSVGAVAKRWDIPLEFSSSMWASVAGLVPESVPVICGLGPITEYLYTPQERIQRISLVQRTLLLTQYLLHLMEK